MFLFLFSTEEHEQKTVSVSKSLVRHKIYGYFGHSFLQDHLNSDNSCVDKTK